MNTIAGPTHSLSSLERLRDVRLAFPITDEAFLVYDTALGAWTNKTAAELALYDDEDAQDAIGTILLDSDTIQLVYNDGTPSITALAIADSITQRIELAKNGALIGTRKQLNFIEGSNITLTTVDDDVGNKVDVTIAASGGGGGSFEASMLILDADDNLVTDGNGNALQGLAP